MSSDSASPSVLSRARCLRQFFDLTESAVIDWIAPGSMEASSSNPNGVTGDAFLAPAPPGARFLKVILEMERKYATASSRPMPKRARRASAKSNRKKAKGDDKISVAATAVATLDGAIAAGTATQAAGHDEEDKDAGADDDEGGEDEDAKSSNDSWYDMDDDFIDDSELLENVYQGEEDEDEDEDESGGRLASSSGGPAAADSGGGEGAESVRNATAAGRLKASGFFISRGELHSEAHLEAERARQSAREAELQRSSPRKRATAALKAGKSATGDGDPVPGSPNRIKAAATAAAAPPPPTHVALAAHSRVWDGKWALRRSPRHPARLAARVAPWWARVARAQARVAEAVLPRQRPCAPTVRSGTRCAASCVCWARQHRRVARPSPQRCASSRRACSSSGSRTPRAIASPR